MISKLTSLKLHQVFIESVFWWRSEKLGMVWLNECFCFGGSHESVRWYYRHLKTSLWLEDPFPAPGGSLANDDELGLGVGEEASLASWAS